MSRNLVTHDHSRLPLVQHSSLGLSGLQCQRQLPDSWGSWRPNAGMEGERQPALVNLSLTHLLVDLTVWMFRVGL